MAGRHDPLDYSKWDNLDFSSDEDDCHPNIEINTWRRLKERMRKEKGIVKREPVLIDKYNTTTVNQPKNKTRTIDSSQDTAADADTENAPNVDTSAQAAPKAISTETKDSAKSGPKSDEPSPVPSQPTSDPTVPTQPSQGAKSSKAQPELPISEEKKEDIPVSNDTNASQDTSTAADAVAAAVTAEEEEVFEARSDPNEFLNANLKKLKKFINIKDDNKAHRFVRKRPYLVHEAAQGYVITYAVDRAVEGATEEEIAQYALRCLIIHNLVESCVTGNVKPEIGVEIFYKRLQHPKLMQEYQKELKKQQLELIERIKARRIERLQESHVLQEEVREEDKAPVGPGGLDPSDVLNTLPKEMADAFVTRDTDALRKALEEMPIEEAQYHMQRCVDSGLWVANANESDETEELVADDTVDID